MGRISPKKIYVDIRSSREHNSLVDSLQLRTKENENDSD